MIKATKNLSHYSPSAGRNLNPRSTIYDAVLSSHSRHTVNWVITMQTKGWGWEWEAGTNYRDPVVCKTARGRDYAASFCLSQWCQYLSTLQINLSNQAQVTLHLTVFPI